MVKVMVKFSVLVLMTTTKTVHYRLRPIKRGQFRFSNFPSHFISVQIFQINFSTLPLILFVSKYFRYVFRTRNEIFFFFYWPLSNNSGRKKGRVEPHLSYPYFWGKQLVHRYLQNNICYFRSPISPWRVPQRKSLFWAFILRMVHIFTIWKISLLRHPLQAFLNIYFNFDQTLQQKVWWKIFGAKFGS